MFHRFSQNKKMTYWLTRVIPPAVVFVLTFCAGLAYTGSRPKQYEASARIWVQIRGIPLQVVGDGSASSYLTSPLTSGGNSLSTSCEVLRSQSVVQSAHDLLAKKIPESKCPSAEAMQAGLSAMPVKDADVIRVSYRAGDSDVALAVVESVVSAFLSENSHQTSGGATQSKALLSKELEAAKKAYDQSIDELQQFKESGDTVDLEAQTASLMEQRSALEKQLVEMKQNGESGAAKMQYLEQQLGISSDDVMKADTVGQDAVVQGLRASIADYEVKLIDLKSKYQEAHPKMRRLRQSLAEAKKALVARLMEISGKPDAKAASTMVTTGSDVQGTLLQDMAQIRAEQVTNKQLTKTIQGMISDLDARLKQVPSKQARLSQLTRKSDIASENLSEVEKQLKAVALTESVAVGSSNLQVIDEPSVSDMTATDQKIAFILAAVLAGLTAGVQFVLDNKLRTTKQIVNAMPITVGAWLPTLKPGTTIRDVLGPLQRLRESIRDWSKEGRKVVIVTSPDSGDGKSTVAYGLALSLSQSGQRVLLIDGNLQHPSLHIFCNKQASPGLFDYLNDEPEEIESISPVAVNKNLFLIPAGRIAPDENVLRHPRFAGVLAQLEQKVDAIIIDTGAAGNSLHSIPALDSDVVMVAVVRLGHSTRHATKLLGAQISMNPRCESLAVVNDVPDQVIISAVVSPAAVAATAVTQLPAEAQPAQDQQLTTANW